MPSPWWTSQSTTSARSREALARAARRARRDVVEEAVAAGEGAAGVVGAAAEVHGDAVLQRVARRGRVPADRAAAALDELRRPGQAEPALLAQAQVAVADAREQRGVVHARERLPGDRRGLVDLVRRGEAVGDDALASSAYLSIGKRCRAGAGSGSGGVSRGTTWVWMLAWRSPLPPRLHRRRHRRVVGHRRRARAPARRARLQRHARRPPPRAPRGARRRAARAPTASTSTSRPATSAARRARAPGRHAARGGRAVVGAVQQRRLRHVRPLPRPRPRARSRASCGSTSTPLARAHRRVPAADGRRGAGAILNVASIAAFQPLPGNATYAATKAFVHSLLRGRARRAEGHRRVVHRPVPGPTRTEFDRGRGRRGRRREAPGFTWQSPRTSPARPSRACSRAGARSCPACMNKAVGDERAPAPRARCCLPLVKTRRPKDALGGDACVAAAASSSPATRSVASAVPPSSRRDSCARRKYSGASCSHVAPMPPCTEMCSRVA